jgi:hypothetical protein
MLTRRILFLNTIVQLIGIILNRTSPIIGLQYSNDLIFRCPVPAKNNHLKTGLAGI